jgi:hypothetical protein
MAELSYESRHIFDLILERVIDIKKAKGFEKPQAFIYWFINIYFNSPQDIIISDGSKDGKVDAFFTTNDGSSVKHHVINAKYTEEYGKTAPVKFYEEIEYFLNVFENKPKRAEYLSKAVKAELRPHYKQLFAKYDEGQTELMFITNHKRNEAHANQPSESAIKLFHLDDLIQYIIDDIDGAMPRTAPLELTNIHQVLAADRSETEVATSIVFARLYDFIRYMSKDPHDLLFARNVRLSLGNTTPNKAIKATFIKAPKEFAYSNNGITILCERHIHDPGTKILQLINPRVVNGSQTLHSIRDVPAPSQNARVMLRIIEIPPITNKDVASTVKKKKEIINKIAIRSNQQNPIKATNLIANDDYQMDLYRYFRRNNLFYERREKEWSCRSRYLKSVGISQGPSLTPLLQLISSYYWKNPGLGPVVAKSPNELCESGKYDQIRKCEPELVYQIYLFNSIISDCNKHLKKLKYIAKYKNYASFTIFSLLVAGMQSAKVKFGVKDFTDTLNTFMENNDYLNIIEKSVQRAYRIVDSHFNNTAKAHRAKTGEVLSTNNFFRNQSFVDKILRPQHVAEVAKTLKKMF